MDSIYLHGSEDVSRAGHSICHAAEAMSRTANRISDDLQMFQNFLDSWLTRFEDVMERNKLNDNPHTGS